MTTSQVNMRAGRHSDRRGPQPHWLVSAAGGWIVLLAAVPAFAQNVLESLVHTPRPGGQVELVLTASGPVADPMVFSTDSPARIALDLPDTRNAIRERQFAVNTGSTSTVSLVEAAGRTRVVVELLRPSTFETRVEGNRLILTVDNGIRGDISSAPIAARDPTKVVDVGGSAVVRSIDFRRGPAGEGRILIEFTQDGAATNLTREGDRIVLDIFNAELPPELSQRLDVLDFATPVQFIETRARGNGARMIISAAAPYEQLAYQAGEQYVIEIAPVRQEQTDPTRRRQEPEYTGSRVTLNFQDIPVRAVLQLLADVSELNIVVSDSTSGNVTLRLINVPWDQALDIVLQAKGLDKRRNGNVIWVAPAQEIANREQALEDARIAMEDRAELIADFIPINYGKAEDIAKLLTQDALTGTGGGQQQGSRSGRGFLSDRGSISFDIRTNTLLVNDIPPRITQIRELVAVLDRPVQQVLIESRIVVANESFARDLGVRFGVAGAREDSRGNVVTAGGRLEATDAMSNVALINRLSGAASGLPVGIPGQVRDSPQPGAVQGIAVPNLIDRLGVNLPVVGAPSYGFTVLGKDYLLDLELSALEAEGKGEVISSPRVITASQQEAVISQGQEVPFQVVQPATGGAAPVANIEFKEAVLELRVTPTISPDQRVFMLLDVSQDSIGGVTPNGEFFFDVRRISTGVLVDNGQTVVLGGIYETEMRRDVTKVPGVGDVPVIGNLFRRQQRSANKRELLIFVTPKILAESLR